MQKDKPGLLIMHASRLSFSFLCFIASSTLAHGDDKPYYRNPNNVDLTVTLDFAEVVKTAQPAATVVVGNSGLLDVNASNSNMLILTGKATGITNVVLFNQKGDRLREYLVEIRPSRRKLTTVHQGAKIETYQCGKGCVPVLSVGDSPEQFDKTKAQNESRSTFSETNGTNVGSDQQLPGGSHQNGFPSSIPQ
jgi:hypothetical protein